MHNFIDELVIPVLFILVIFCVIAFLFLEV